MVKRKKETRQLQTRRQKRKAIPRRRDAIWKERAPAQNTIRPDSGYDDSSNQSATMSSEEPNNRLNEEAVDNSKPLN